MNYYDELKPIYQLFFRRYKIDIMQYYHYQLPPCFSDMTFYLRSGQYFYLSLNNPITIILKERVDQENELYNA